MHNLLRFIKMYHFLLLFIVIEGFSVFLLSTNNSFFRYTILEHSQPYTGSAQQSFNATVYYFNLKQENKLLIEENAKLHTLLSNSQSTSSDSITIRNKKYTYTAATVINNSVFKRNNFLTLNKGRKHGIKKGMGVITSDGIAGIIHSVSNQFSLVLSVLHQKSTISVRLKKQGNIGFLKWHGFDYREANIVNIPNHITLTEGDTISTSGFGTIFPEKINLGIIQSYKNIEEKGYYLIKMRFFTDMNKLRYVYIVHSLESKEQKTLENNHE